eukprot:5998760-Pyramimonas_sp.AAC.1
MGAMAHCFLRAAALASNLWLAREAAPGKASTSNACTSIKPPGTRRSRGVLSVSPLSFLTNLHMH